MSQEQDKIFFRNYSIVIGILAVFLFFSFVLAQFVGIDEEKAMKQREALTAEMTEPEGSVSVEGVDEAPELEEVAEEAEEVAAGPKSGEEVYNGMCKMCHAMPGIGAPVVGNAEEWAPRIAKGTETLYNNAINGFSGPEGFMMPPRGGGNFTDDEVKAAVDYMIAQSQ